MEFCDGSVAQRIECRGDIPFDQAFQHFPDTADTTHVTALVIGRWGEVSQAEGYPGLRCLVLQSGGLHPEAIRGIGECGFPELRHLELYPGHPNWCGWAKPEDLAWLLSGGTFPTPDHLNLRNALIRDGVEPHGGRIGP